MQHIHQEFPKSKPKRNSTKIYFFILAIIFLLATNIYYIVEYRSLGKKVEILGSEKYQLQIEIDRIEAELDRIVQDNPLISQALLGNQEQARSRIAHLRLKLNSDEISREDIKTAQFEVQNLRYLIDEYSKSIDQLKKENINLSSERDRLKSTVNTTQEKVEKLTEENTALLERVETAAGLRISGININAIHQRSRDREKIETRAKRADLIRLDFDLVENPLAQKGNHDVFVRVIDPNGNLLTFDSGTFSANGKTLQYTFHTSIDFSNDGKKYTLDWLPPKSASNFQKGTYTFILYSDGYRMGRSSLTLK